MKKYYLLLLLFLVPLIVNAEEKIIKTELVDFSIETWIDENNESHYKLYFNSENLEGNSFFQETGTGNLTNKTYEIRFIRNIECNLTSESLMLDYFKECGDEKSPLPCKDAYLNCKSDLNTISNMSSCCSSLDSCYNTKTYWETEARLTLNDFMNFNETMNITISNLTSQKNKAETTRVWVGLIALAIGYIISNLGKNPKSKTEKETGYSAVINNIKKKFFPGGETQERSKGELRVG